MLHKIADYIFIGQLDQQAESSKMSGTQQICIRRRITMKKGEEMVNNADQRSKRRRKNNEEIGKIHQSPNNSSEGKSKALSRRFRPSFLPQLKSPLKWLPPIILLHLLYIQFTLASTNEMPTPMDSSPSTMARSSQFTVEERTQLRQAFLRKFGLDHLANGPIEGGNPRKRAAKTQSATKMVPDYIWALYEAHSTAAPATVQAQTIRHYVPSMIRPIGENRVWLAFNLSATGRESEKEYVMRAELRLPDWKMPTIASTNASRLSVFKHHPNGQEEKEKIATKEWANFAQKPWIEMDGELLFIKNGTNQGIGDELHLMLHFPAEIAQPEAEKMLKSAALIVYSKERKEEDLNSANARQNFGGRQIRRAKRWATTSDERGGNDSDSSSGRQQKHQRSSSSSSRRMMASSGAATSAGSSSARNGVVHHRHHRPHNAGQCRRAELYVDFAELNWQDWIMAPNGYDAYQCKGRCSHPMPAHLNTTNHAIVQSLIHSIDPSAAPAPSCVPVEMSAISILYRDMNDVIVVKTYADMRVEACGCH